jgi:hypothetical protein
MKSLQESEMKKINDNCFQSYPPSPLAPYTKTKQQNLRFSLPRMYYLNNLFTPRPTPLNFCYPPTTPLTIFLSFSTKNIIFT